MGHAAPCKQPALKPLVRLPLLQLAVDFIVQSRLAWPPEASAMLFARTNLRPHKDSYHAY